MPGDITTHGGGCSLRRHSPLKQIDRNNVIRLVPVWNLSLSNNNPQEGQPLLVDGVMYQTTTDATVALDPVTGRQLWRRYTTAGGLVFSGRMDGEFAAYDSATGEKLWGFQTGSGIVGIPMTWERDGVQYVTVASGIGGAYALYSGDERLQNVSPGGSLGSFALFKDKR